MQWARIEQHVSLSVSWTFSMLQLPVSTSKLSMLHTIGAQKAHGKIHMCQHIRLWLWLWLCCMLHLAMLLRRCESPSGPRNGL